MPSVIVNNFMLCVPHCLLTFRCLCVILYLMKVKELNTVATTTEMNLAAAKCCETFPKACLLFRMLEHANNRGTGEHQYDILEDYFNKKEFTW